ncbi:phosphoenolpyruvate--protein phosphotransferase [Roseospira marina]|uniref:phosphoenolpyruvate--protein phosphotransferase n=1 Tax=Roseospira marina TaxID=140057 RepID=A0A5M6IDU0_9PROT|nr:phosphoenolpyruvate--protein phosphotransferase [Roseospira marina]KAA5606451.1 phosphoenolpyruvate--protein phosphotransferase [Roseospira marina]MBB4314134.1 phosphotransferase system enzyme I (PtsP) [Roseospira marina]MBB5087295.1 phosphotransferase system enzyme I (PtsP) [Roseospira marina]
MPFSDATGRRLLGRLREYMAGGGTVQERLDRTVRLIAEELRSDVCSCYVMRAGEVLELFATEGLSQTAVHVTRLRVSEGLVGEIAARARPLNAPNAWDHPSFAYRPETGEDVYASLMGVPMIRGGQVIGVLVVQNRDRRAYQDIEVETLETVAMVLAELLAGTDLIPRDELGPVTGNAVLPFRMEGLALNPGAVIGTAVYHRPKVHIERLISDDPEEELRRLREALKALRQSLDELIQTHVDLSGDYREVLEAYRMFADDAGWVSRISDAIRSGLTAEAAVRKVDDDMKVRLAQASDPYIRERLHDLEDLANRLLLHLTGQGMTSAQGELPEDTILICRSLGPAELLDYPRGFVRGVLMEEGAPTMHAVIVARALDIPVIGRLDGVFSRIAPFDTVALDAGNGQIFVRPSDDLRETFSESVASRQARRQAYLAERDRPFETRDGVPVRILMNAGLLMDMGHLEDTGAMGVGLYRTELPFMARPSLPDVATQTVLYQKIRDQAAGRPVVFRTLDVGGDKLLPYWSSDGEDNPAMGWRSIRITLDRPAVLRAQVRALLRASAGADLDMMFPMIATVAEFEQARRLLDVEVARERARGGALPSAIRVGTMLEVPALLYQFPELLRKVDFVSVGSNDLLQFLFATDRGNPRVSSRYDTVSVPVLRLLRQVREQCDAAGKPVTVCGEMAGRPLEAMTLIGLGFRSLSMAAPGIGPVKHMLRSMDFGEVKRYVNALVESSDPNPRRALRAFARDHGIKID